MTVPGRGRLKAGARAERRRAYQITEAAKARGWFEMSGTDVGRLECYRRHRRRDGLPMVTIHRRSGKADVHLEMPGGTRLSADAQAAITALIPEPSGIRRATVTVNEQKAALLFVDPIEARQLADRLVEIATTSATEDLR